MTGADDQADHGATEKLTTELSPPPPSAESVFGECFPAARRYVEILADTGVAHGLIGPREVERLWGRHVLNCAVLAELIPQGVTLIDVGSGAGLPGIAVALARPDLNVHLVEPMARRVAWLEEAIEQLGLQHVGVHHGRADEVDVIGDVVTARAVSRLSTLSGWMAPLVGLGGLMLALKGSSAQEELARDRAAAGRAGWSELEVVHAGVGVLDQPTTVIRGRRVEARRRRQGRGRRTRR